MITFIYYLRFFLTSILISILDVSVIKKRFSKKLTLIYTLIFITITFCSLAIIYYYFNLDEVLKNGLLIILALEIGFMLLISDQKPFKTLYITFFVTFNCFVSSFISFYLAKSLMIILSEDNILYQLITELIIRTCLLSGMIVLSYKKYRLLFEKIFANLQKGWGTYSLVTAIFTLALYFLAVYPETYVNKDIYNSIQIIFIAFTGYAMYFVFVQAQLNLIKSYEEKFEQSQIAHQLVLWNKEYQKISEETELIKKFRHELRHNVIVLDEMIKNNQNEEASEYLHSMTEVIEKTKSNTYCSNVVLNSIINAYIESYNEDKITFDLNIKIPNELKIDDIDLCGLVSNIIENGIEALKKVNDIEKRVFHLSLIYKNKSLFINSENYTSEENIFENGLPISTKKIKSGFGTKVIKNIVLKYHGILEMKNENHIFKVQAIIYEK